MRGLRFDRLMSGVALALPLTVVLAIPPLQRPSQHPDPGGDRIGRPDAGRHDDGPADRGGTAAPSTTQGIGGNEPTATRRRPNTDRSGRNRHHDAGSRRTRCTGAGRNGNARRPKPVDPLASLDPADRPLAEKLRDLLPKADRTFASRKERLAVEAFYQKRNYAPVWFERGAVSRAHQCRDHPHPCVDRRRPDPGRVQDPGDGRDRRPRRRPRPSCA